MRRAIGLTMGLLLLAPAAHSQGWAQRVTLEVKQTPLRAVFAQFTRLTGFRVVVDPNAPDIPVTLNVRDVSPDALMRIITRQAATAIPGLASGRDGNIYIIRIRPIGDAEEHPVDFGRPDPRLNRKVSLSLERVTLREAVDQVLARSGVQYAVDPQVPQGLVSLKVKDVSNFEALRALLEEGRLSIPELEVMRVRGVYIFRFVPLEPPNARASLAAQTARVTVNLQGSTLSEVLNAVFRGTGLQYSVPPQLQKTPVSVRAENITLREALELINRSAPVRIILSGDIFMAQRAARKP